MKLAHKVPLITTCIILLFSIFILIIQNKMTIADFKAIEQKQAKAHIDRVERELRKKSERLSHLLYEWSAWDENYNFTQTLDPKFVKNNSPQESVKHMRLSSMIWLNNQFKVIWQQKNELLSQNIVKSQQINDYINQYIRPHIVAQDRSKALEKQSVHNFVVINNQFYITAIRPIIQGNNSGPIVGHLIFVREINDELIQELSDALLLDIHLSQTPPAIPMNKYHFNFKSSAVLVINKVVQGLNKQDTIQISVSLERNIMREASESVKESIAIMLFSSLILIVVISLILHFDIVTPIARWTATINEIISSKDFSKSVPVKRKDEIGLMQQQFNVLLNQIEQSNKKLAMLATTDSLTGLANRHALERFLNHEWQRGIREQTPISLIICDIDFFKQYNDNYGHQKGDECLKIFSDALQSPKQRKTDLVARYGGEEFVIVLPNTALDGAIKRAEKLQQAIAKKSIPHHYSKISNVVTASIGIATIIPSPSTSHEALIKNADEKLYLAKSSGRNSIKA